ncbi:heterogeneous nuclear ribonucleoprotein R-like isoform X2 [Gigantopelta aegis]|uniref:heterogeneous nuclear ribonucleoprotein R-like isoform X2 n=1 Tax=Gigantopelta aegis TaxID=1735272 RepID=UPI001B88E612|nr:heterogeneous nuclear ribonucleoprotein R-like isoform X2 [Gigantopelta aegis]
MALNGEEQMDEIAADQVPAEDVDMENGYAEDLKKLMDYGISKAVSLELVKIYGTGKLSASELDERALDALKEFNADDAIKVLKEFSSSNLEHVTNKSAWLCGQMKTYRQKRQAGGAASLAKGPDEAKLKEILDRTGYSLDVTTGQRKYGGPPPESDETQPGTGHEIFCGKIPKDIFEDELIPLFEKCGKIWDLRLMMDPLTGLNRGYCFVTFCEIAGAKEAVKQLDNYEIRKGKTLKVNVSVANVRLFVGNIPKNKTREEIKDEFGKRTEGLMDVIIYGSADNPKLKNRGFSFLEFDSHKSASTAKRKLSSGRVKVWGCDIIVDWADPQEEPDEETMSKVKVLYVRNLNADITEETLKEKFEQFGKVERVKKIKDYGFVHFEERDDAVKAMETMNGEKLGSLEIEVSLAKPPTDNKKKEQRKRDTVRVPRGGYVGWDDYWGPPMGRMPLGPPGRGMRRPMPPPRGFGGGYAWSWGPSPRWAPRWARGAWGPWPRAPRGKRRTNATGQRSKSAETTKRGKEESGSRPKSGSNEEEESGKLG